MATSIQILPSKKIDPVKWDACVSAAENGLIYSRYDYLDQLCTNWSAVIVDDYRSIMPLPWRRKFGIKYIYQPVFIQQLGMIGDSEIIPEHFFHFAKYGDMLLNFQNTDMAKALNASPRSNLVIDLSLPYETTFTRYKKDLLLNLKKAEKESLSVSAEVDTDLAVSMFKLLYQRRMDDLTDKDFANFATIAEKLAGKNMCFTRKVLDEKGTLLAIALFLRDDKRIYNLMNTTTDIGRTKEANHFLIDAVIKEFSGQPLLFDFEGSDIPGVKTFYEKFGGIDQPYYYYHFNKLPGFVKLLKK